MALWRIVRWPHGKYGVECRTRFWPFWDYVGWGMGGDNPHEFNTIEGAEEFARSLMGDQPRKIVVKELY